MWDKRHNAGPWGRWFPQQNPLAPLAPMGRCIGANGLILLREPASLPLPRHCDVYSRALHCSDIHVYGICRLVMLRDPCLFLRNSHGGE